MIRENISGSEVSRMEALTGVESDKKVDLDKSGENRLHTEVVENHHPDIVIPVKMIVETSTMSHVDHLEDPVTIDGVVVGHEITLGNEVTLYRMSTSGVSTIDLEIPTVVRNTFEYTTTGDPSGNDTCVNVTTTRVLQKDRLHHAHHTLEGYADPQACHNHHLTRVVMDNLESLNLEDTVKIQVLDDMLIMQTAEHSTRTTLASRPRICLRTYR